MPVGTAPNGCDGSHVEIISRNVDDDLNGDRVEVVGNVVNYLHVVDPVNTGDHGCLLEVELVTKEVGEIEDDLPVSVHEDPSLLVDGPDVLLGGLPELDLVTELGSDEGNDVVVGRTLNFLFVCHVISPS